VQGGRVDRESNPPLHFSPTQEKPQLLIDHQFKGEQQQNLVKKGE
jgi:hypothetical protein